VLLLNLLDWEAADDTLACRSSSVVGLLPLHVAANQICKAFEAEASVVHTLVTARSVTEEDRSRVLMWSPLMAAPEVLLVSEAKLAFVIKEAAHARAAAEEWIVAEEAVHHARLREHRAKWINHSDVATLVPLVGALWAVRSRRRSWPASRLRAGTGSLLLFGFFVPPVAACSEWSAELVALKAAVADILSVCCLLKSWRTR